MLLLVLLRRLRVVAVTVYGERSDVLRISTKTLMPHGVLTVPLSYRDRRSTAHSA